MLILHSMIHLITWQYIHNQVPQIQLCFILENGSIYNLVLIQAFYSCQNYPFTATGSSDLNLIQIVTTKTIMLM